MTCDRFRCIIDTSKRKGEVKMPIPNDPMILLSYINTQLRDFYPSLEEFGKTNNIDIKIIKEKLSGIGYESFCLNLLCRRSCGFLIG